MRRSTWVALALAGAVAAGVAGTVLAQEAAAPAAAPAAGETVTVAPGMEVAKDAAQKASKKANPMSFWNVVVSSGWMGILLWVGLFGSSIAGFALIVDCAISVREKKIVPESLVEKVRTAMEQGDVVKAIKNCEETPGPLANILTAGFSNVQEGFDTIQEAIGVAADLETEKLMQRVSYLNVVSNIAPMLGLLGTVQGMIYAFAVLGTSQAGAMQQSQLAVNIAQALYTTAAGLLAAVPALIAFYFFKNRASKIILGMEALTFDLIKSLRNVEIVSE